MFVVCYVLFVYFACKSAISDVEGRFTKTCFAASEVKVFHSESRVTTDAGSVIKKDFIEEKSTIELFIFNI